MEKRITEKELVIPALWVINQYPSITTTELIRELYQIMQPDGKDNELISTRNDTYFSQKVRNLKSHDTLAEYTTYSNGVWEINDFGRQMLADEQEYVKTVLLVIGNQFEYQDKLEFLQRTKANKVTTVYDENDLICEGNIIHKTHKYRERSKQLREAAIKKYTKNGHIICELCNFDFAKSYPVLGNGFIEIHHKKPICEYEDESEAVLISRALENLCPVCSNCHRMLHRKKDTKYEDVLKAIEASRKS